jgi:hypothetical protein
VISSIKKLEKNMVLTEGNHMMESVLAILNLNFMNESRGVANNNLLPTSEFQVRF